MAVNNFDPTAANILSSLGIKGTASVGGTDNSGKVPVIGKKGSLDVSLIPIDDLTLRIKIPSLENTAFIDPRAGSGVIGYEASGSIAYPFRSLTEAAKTHSGKTFANFILVSDTAGNFGTENVNFETSENIIRIYTTGTAQFQKLSFSGYQGGTVFYIDNVSVVQELSFLSSASCSAKISGIAEIGTVVGKVDDTDDPDVTTSHVSKVEIGPSVKVDEFKNIAQIGFLSKSSRIENSSTVVAGKTVSEATDNLGKRRIRIPKFTADEEGIHVTQTDDVQIESDSSDDYDIHDITEIGTTLADAANETFYKENDSPTFNEITATAINTVSVTAATINTPKLNFGSKILTIDSDNFLVITESEDSSWGSSDSSDPVL